jgi:DNA-binding transcriptional MerR regulator
MTNGDPLTLAELADAVGMTARNVRAYQTRGLLQPPRRSGRTSVYGDEHVRRLMQVQQARARGASLALLRTLIREGRDLEGVWAEPRAADPDDDTASPRLAEPGPTEVDLTEADLTDVDLTDVHLTDVHLTDAAVTRARADHTPDCLARREVPLAPLLARVSSASGDATEDLAASVRALVEAGVFTSDDGEVRVPGSFACAASALADQGQLATAAALRLAVAVTDAARSIAVLVAATARTVDAEGRRAAAARLGELAAAVVGQLAGREVMASGEAATGGGGKGGTAIGGTTGEAPAV